MKKSYLSALLLLSSPTLAMEVMEPSRELAHGHSVGDHVLIGNALVGLQDAACAGDAKAAASLGRKYYSGTEEFQANPSKAEPYLLYAAEHGVPGAVVELVLHFLKKQPSVESIQAAGVWLRVARYLEPDGSAYLAMIESAFRIALSNLDDFTFAEGRAAKDATLIIHRMRNGLAGIVEAPCP